jgi:hypothetical protein
VGWCLLLGCARSVAPSSVLPAPSTDEAGFVDATDGEDAAGIYTGRSWGDVLSVDPADIHISGRNEVALVEITVDADGGMWLAGHGDNSSESIWPDGGRSRPCRLPIMFSGSRGQFLPGAMCMEYDFLSAVATVLQGQIQLDGNHLQYWIRLHSDGTLLNSLYAEEYAGGFDGFRY